MAGKTAKIKGKRITGKQRVARVKNIEVARRYRKKASGSNALPKGFKIKKVNSTDSYGNAVKGYSVWKGSKYGGVTGTKSSATRLARAYARGKYKI